MGQFGRDSPTALVTPAFRTLTGRLILKKMFCTLPKIIALLVLLFGAVLSLQCVIDARAECFIRTVWRQTDAQSPEAGTSSELGDFCLT
jgi:hypothetical protein